MPNLCGCAGDSPVGRLHWPWRKNASVSATSSVRRFTTLGESVDDADVAKSPSLAKPEMDDTTTPRNSIPHEAVKSSRPPVTFELDSVSRGCQDNSSEKDRHFKVRNHSLDIEVGSILPQNVEMSKTANRTFPTFFNSKSTRASSRLYPNYNPILLRRGSLLIRSGRPLPTSILMNQQSMDGLKITSTGLVPGALPSPGIGEGHGTKERFLDESLIVTPFAQILAGLRSVQTNIAWLTSQHYLKTMPERDTSRKSVDMDHPSPISVEDYDSLAEATRKELEWCLQQLENIQTKRPVSDMATTKFKRLLSQKLGNYSSTDKTRNQISEYISKTFMEEYSEQDYNEDEEADSSSNALATGSEALGNSRTDITGFSLESSVDGADARISKRFSKSEQSEVSATATLPDTSSSPANTKSNFLNALGSRKNLNNLPYLGIKTPNDEAIRKEFEASLDSWSLNMFDIDTLSGQHSLTVVAYRIFSKRGLFHTFNIDPTDFVTYILRLEAAYHSTNPYHNHIHGADVLQTVHVLLQAETLVHVFSDIEILSSLFASAIHDVHHPGVTNQFLINTGHKLALLYNDASVLENHHLSVAFKLLTEPSCDIFANLAPKQRQLLRRLVIELVLATDMSKHMNLLAELRTMVETKELTGTGYLSLDDHNDRSLVLQCMLHCADLSSPTKPFPIYKQWTYGVMEEFFKQGDKEKELGIEVSAMCDRDSVVVDKAQIGFIDFVIHPLWDTWCDLIHPAGEHILEALDANRDIILNQSPFKEFETQAKRQVEPTK
ncbi:cAMP-specific 3'5'-cyclic phosphodiesterase isoform F [Taenia crassiceps]|uniref:Phosphodiesterase n=1 Tax=Taenia crassiceps TaxID=6207 RepID=A0ABR4Q992_9CEST